MPQPAYHRCDKKPKRNISNEKLLQMGPVNTRGFPSLSADLLLEITSHYESVHVPPEQQTVYDRKCSERRTALLALSQTCVRLRDIFLPLAWQQMELRENKTLDDLQKDLPAIQRHSDQEFAMQLTRLLEVVTLSNSVPVSYIEVINVVVPNNPSETTFKELVLFLQLLPNLRTIQLLDLQDNFAGAFVEAFDYKKCILSRVQTLSIAETAFHLVACCPSVKNVIIMGSCRSRFVRTLASQCKDQLFENKGTSVIEYFPQVTSITHYFCDGDLTMEETKRLTALKHLYRLRIRTVERSNWTTVGSPKDMEDHLILHYMDVNGCP